MTERDRLGANPEDGLERETVDSPQAGGEAGEHSSWENDGGDLEGPHNGEGDLEGELEDMLEDADSDETDDGGPLVSRLRQESSRYRRRLRDTELELEEIRGELWTARVEALGMLADPADLPYEPEALEDPDRLRELAEQLIEQKPHLRTRRIRARAGQGEGGAGGEFSLAGMLRRGA